MNPSNRWITQRRLPKFLAPYVFALYMAIVMSFLMSMVITFTEFGYDSNYLRNVMSAYRVAMPAAFICILIVRPLVARLVALSVSCDV